MGAGQSTSSKLPQRALHVLRVTPSSPASQTTIEPYFDFLVGFKDQNLTSDGIDAPELERIVENYEGRSLDLLVWNSKSQTTRVVPITPSRQWALPHAQPDPKEPDSDQKPSLLGLSMRMCEPEFAVENVWHVLDVLEGSPAESAGLVPYGDWIIGWSGGVLSAEGDFYEVVESHIDKPLRVYVYSYDFDNIREVVMVPNRHWGGDGLLGCIFGFGLLHRIPPIPETREPGALPAELAEQPEYEEQHLFVPADITEDRETPEQTEERLQWEQEELERETYARNYAATVNQTPASAYDLSLDSEPSVAAPHATDSAVKRDTVNASEVPQDRPVVQAPVAVTASAPQNSAKPSQITLKAGSRPITPVRSPPPSVPRSATPTPTRPFGFHMNGLGIRPHTPSWDVRMFDLGNRDSASPRSAAADHEDDRDASVSVADTEATDTTGTGSLTSVD